MSELDYMSALRSWLVNETGSSRIYIDGAPKGTIDKRNPTQAAVLVRAGGSGQFGFNDNLPLAQQRFDLICYGETTYEANNFYRTLAEKLRALKRVIQSGVMLHSITKSGGVIRLTDPDTDLPIVVQPFQLNAEV